MFTDPAFLEVAFLSSAACFSLFGLQRPMYPGIEAGYHWSELLTLDGLDLEVMK